VRYENIERLKLIVTRGINKLKATKYLWKKERKKDETLAVKEGREDTEYHLTVVFK
jgi:hypothetical protein